MRLRLAKLNDNLLQSKRLYLIFGLIVLFLTRNLVEIYSQNEPHVPMFLWLFSIFQDYYFALYGFPIIFILLLMSYPDDLTSNPLLIGRLHRRKKLVIIELLTISKLVGGFILTIVVTGVLMGLFQFTQNWEWTDLNQRLYFTWTDTIAESTISPMTYVITIIVMTIFYYMFLGLIFRLTAQITGNRGLGMLLSIVLIGMQAFVAKSGISGGPWDWLPSAHYLNYFSQIKLESFTSKLFFSVSYWLIILGILMSILQSFLMKKNIRR